MSRASQKIEKAASEEVQLKLLYGDDSRFRYWESHLFNEVYLRKDLPEKHADKWNDVDALSFQHFMNTLRTLAEEYGGSNSTPSGWSETETINNWVKYVLDALGWKDNCSGVQNPFLEETSFRFDDKTLRTDILIVDDPREKQYIKNKNGSDRLVEARNSVLIPVEVKYWQRLEEYRQGKSEQKGRRDNESDDLEQTLTPNEQVTQYMQMLKRPWGILTDGAKWRLFNSDLSLEDSNRYFEFNLFSLIQSLSTAQTDADRAEIVESAKYFFHFFSKEALCPKDEANESFVAEVLHFSKKYVGKVEEDLKDRFVKAMNIACNEIFRASGGSKDKANIEGVRNVAESTLFNILFIKSLESRNILPMNATDYRKISLSSLIDKIEKFDPEKDDFLNHRELERAFKKGNGNSFQFTPTGTELHERIVRLIEVIHDGKSSKDDFGFEIAGFKETIFSKYEWGMFKTAKIKNNEWVRILFQLGYAESESSGRKYQQIPYSYFTPRQLGSIYESFLEFQLEKADTDLIYKDRQWQSANLDSRIYKNSELPKVRKGELFFTPDNKDRKATGSYYTPDYVVKYVVKETLDPLVKNLKSKEILSLKVCDPAMGSGHFLVSTLNYLCKAFLKQKLIEVGDFPDQTISEIKQLVLKSSVYGVDINTRAVKLARMSLWLETARVNGKLENLEQQVVNANSLMSSTLARRYGNGSMSFKWKPLDVKSMFPKVDNKFDAIVGNPPWGAELSDESHRILQAEFKELGDKGKDSFKYFIAKGFELSDVAGWVVPNTILTRNECSDVRRVLSEKRITHFVNLGDGVFENVTRPSCIVICNRKNSSKPMAADLSTLKSNDEKSEVLFGSDPEVWQPLSLSEQNGEVAFALAKNGDEALLLDILGKKAEHNLGEYLDFFSKGVELGCADAFLIEKGQLGKSEYILPIVRGRDIERTGIKSPKNEVIVLNGVAEKDIPKNIRDHLANFSQDLKSRKCVVAKKRKWYELNSMKDFTYFKGDRILLRETGDSLIACKNNGFVTQDTVHNIKVKDEFSDLTDLILELFSSSIVNKLFSMVTNEKGAVFAKVKQVYVYKIPMPNLIQLKKIRAKTKTIDSAILKAWGIEEGSKLTA